MTAASPPDFGTSRSEKSERTELSAASSEEMKSSSTWEITSLRFAYDDTNPVRVNEELAKYPGWEPFDSFWRTVDGSETWTLLLKREVPAE